MTTSIMVYVCNCFIEGIDNLDSHSHSEIFDSPVGIGLDGIMQALGLLAVFIEHLGYIFADIEHHSSLRKSSQKRHKATMGKSSMHEKHLRCIAGRWILRLRVQGDFDSHYRVCIFVHIDMAYTIRMPKHRYAAFRLYLCDEFLGTTRND